LPWMYVRVKLLPAVERLNYNLFTTEPGKLFISKKMTVGNLGYWCSLFFKLYWSYV
jgi:hypothetical protein